jgi:CRISPR system Cascade subunit CasB
MARRKGDSALVSELRFRRLLQCDRKKLYGSLIRILRLLDDTADLYDLAESVYFWGESVKKIWAYAYFPLAPEKKTA